MNTFQIAIDTILLCFCEDCKSNDGSRERPYYMTDTLLSFVDSHDHNTIASLQVIFYVDIYYVQNLNFIEQKERGRRATKR
jgi:hypothetical protein